MKTDFKHASIAGNHEPLSLVLGCLGASIGFRRGSFWQDWLLEIGGIWSGDWTVHLYSYEEAASIE